MSDPHKDEHIEELLSKLQGIFGKLSHTEEEEAKTKIEVTRSAPQEKDMPAEAPPATPVSKAPPASPASSLPLYNEPAPAEPSVTSAPPPASPPPAASPSLPGSTLFESIVPLEDPEKLIVPTAVFYIPGRENEAKSLAQRLEVMAPKFTKVAFRLRVALFMPYEPRSEWQEFIMARAAESAFQTAFVLVDRPLEDNRRKQVSAELEGRGIYFQEVPYASIEKKAFYTDVLLGLVFFFDSRKPTSEGPKP